jgi:hypothetical protein
MKINKKIQNKTKGEGHGRYSMVKLPHAEQGDKQNVIM